MRAILNFLIKHNHWFLFILLEGISFVLIVCFNNFHKATFFTSANSVVGNIYSAVSDIEGYFNLKDENSTLTKHNQELLNEIESLKGRLMEYEDSASLANNEFIIEHNNDYRYTVARVVNNSTNKVNNFLTIDKGIAQGIDAKMGVFNEKGVIGVTYTSSGNFSVVMPLLNSKSAISCKVKNSTFCTLRWDGSDTRYSYIIDLPRYEIFETGDTVATNGYSSIFPSGIPVGTIDKLEDSADGQSYRARVRLFVDFSDINKVYIVGNTKKAEQDQLEESIKKK